MNKVYMVGVGQPIEVIEAARRMVEAENKELIVVESEADLPKPINLTLTARPVIPDIHFEYSGGYNNMTSKKHKKNLYNRPAKYF